MTQTAKVLGKGQVTVPLAVRKEMGLQEGDEVIFIVTTEGHVRLERIPAVTTAEESFGILHRSGEGPLDVERARREYRTELAKRYQGSATEAEN